MGIALAYAVVATVAAAAVERRSGQATIRIWRWMRPFELLLAPVAAPLTWLSRLVQRLVPEVQVQDPSRLAELTVEHVIEQGEEEGAIAEDHAQMLRSVLEFKNTVAREIMVPRTQVVALELSTPVNEVLASIMESGHSRYPVYRGQIDHVEGVLYAKDLFQVLQSTTDASTISLENVVRKPVFFAAESQKIGVLLREMQRRRSHLAVVVDEFGGAAGIVTLEDIVEEIVGEIQDEHDDDATACPRALARPLLRRREYLGLRPRRAAWVRPVYEDKTDFDSLGRAAHSPCRASSGHRRDPASRPLPRGGARRGRATRSTRRNAQECTPKTPDEPEGRRRLGRLRRFLVADPILKDVGSAHFWGQHGVVRNLTFWRSSDRADVYHVILLDASLEWNGGSDPHTMMSAGSSLISLRTFPRRSCRD